MHQIKDDNLGAGEKPDYFTLRCWVSSSFRSPPPRSAARALCSLSLSLLLSLVLSRACSLSLSRSRSRSRAFSRSLARSLSGTLMLLRRLGGPETRLMIGACDADQITYFKHDGTFCYVANPENKKKVIQQGDSWWDESQQKVVEKCVSPQRVFYEHGFIIR